MKRASIRCHLWPKAASCIRCDCPVLGASPCMVNRNTSFDMPPLIYTPCHRIRPALGLLRHDKPGLLLRLRRSIWSGLLGRCRLGSGAGYALVWLALVLIPVIHGTAWWTVTVEYPTAPALRGAKPGHWRNCAGTCNAISPDVSTSREPRYYATPLRCYTPANTKSQFAMCVTQQPRRAAMRGMGRCVLLRSGG